MLTESQTCDIYAGVVDFMQREYQSLQAFIREDKSRAGEELEEATELLRRAEARTQQAEEASAEARATMVAALEERNAAGNELALAREERSTADEEWVRAQAEMSAAQMERAAAQVELSAAQEERAAAQAELSAAQAERAAARADRERSGKERAEARKADNGTRRRLDEAKRLEEEARRRDEEATARCAETAEQLRAVKAERAGVDEALRLGKEEAALRRAQHETERMRVKDEMSKRAEAKANALVDAADEEAKGIVLKGHEEARLLVEAARAKADAEVRRVKAELKKARAMLEKDKAEARRAVDEMRMSHKRIAPTTERFVSNCDKLKNHCEERIQFFDRQVKTFQALARQHSHRVLGGIAGIQLLSHEITRVMAEVQCAMGLTVPLPSSSSSSFSSSNSSSIESPVEALLDAGCDAKDEMDFCVRECELLSEVDRLKDAVLLERRRALVARDALERVRTVHADEVKCMRAEYADMHRRHQDACFAAVNLAQALQDNLCTECKKPRDQAPVGLGLMVTDSQSNHRDLVYALCRPGFSGRKKLFDELDRDELRELLRCCATTMGVDKREMLRLETEFKRAEAERVSLKGKLCECFAVISDTYDLVHGLQLVYEGLPRDAKDSVIKMQLASHVQLEAVLKLLENASNDLDSARSDLMQEMQLEEGVDAETSRAKLEDFSNACKGTLRFLRGLFQMPDTMNQIGILAHDTLDCIVNMPQEKVRDTERAVGFMPGTDKLRTFLDGLKDFSGGPAIASPPCEGCGAPRRLPGGEFQWGGEYDAQWTCGAGGGGGGADKKCDAGPPKRG